jgi:pyruvate kinase
VLGNSQRASTTYAKFAQDVKPGDRVLLADGAVELRALASDGVCVRFEVISGGPVGSNKGINLPGVNVSSPSLTEKDLSDLKFGLTAGVDLVALSFVRSSADVAALRQHIGKPARVVAKIENPAAWDHIEEILDEADGVMVARGDLGVEMALERVPPIQKSVIRRARRRGKFVITATQMLESMIERPTPTRAEVSDVANAIYDGTDAVMLSAETSIGKYPVEAVRFMARIAAEADDSIRKRGYQDPPHAPHPSNAEILADAAHHAARAARVSAIVVFTSEADQSARLVSRYRPPVPIYAVTPSEIAARQLRFITASFPFWRPKSARPMRCWRRWTACLLNAAISREGDIVVFVAGQPVGRNGNLMKLHHEGTTLDHCRRGLPGDDRRNGLSAKLLPFAPVR